jgi:hypothetical protein
VRVPVADLTDPGNRVRVRHPSGHKGPGFLVAETLVWGFTAGIIDRILHHSGWEREWDRDRVVDLSADVLRLDRRDLDRLRELGLDRGWQHKGNPGTEG